jgi:hypothetical protein
MGGCAMVGQSIINIKSGGRGRLSGIVAAVALLLFILYLSEYIEMIPIAVKIKCHIRDMESRNATFNRSNITHCARIKSKPNHR